MLGRFYAEYHMAASECGWYDDVESRMLDEMLAHDEVDIDEGIDLRGAHHRPRWTPRSPTP